MNGWVDGDTKRWRDLYGLERRLTLTKHGQMACPECRARGQKEMLYTMPPSPAWRCSQQHEFESASLPRVSVPT